jgi:hypothetical protein
MHPRQVAKIPAATKNLGWTPARHLCKFAHPWQTEPNGMRFFCAAAASRLTVLAIFFGAGAAQGAARAVFAENVAYDVGGAHVRVSRIAAEDSKATPEELSRLFDAGDPAALDARLDKFAAAKVTIPELVIESGDGASAQKLVYRDIVFSRVAGGRVGEASVAALEQTAASPKGKSVVAHYDNISAKGVDLRRMLRLMTTARAKDGETPQPVEDEIAIGGGAITHADAHLELRLGRLVAKGVRARALATPWSRLSTPQEGGADAAATAALADALTGVECDALEAEGVTLSGLAAPQNKPYSVTLGRFAAHKFAAGALGDLALDDFALTSADGGTLKLRRLALQGLNARAYFETPAPRFPPLEHVELAELFADSPDPEAGGRMKFSIGVAAADFSAFREGLPTKISGRFEKLAIDLSARGEAPSTASALALGYRTLEFSGGFDASWREKEEELTFDSLRLDGKDMGAVRVAALFGRVSSAVFSANSVLARAAALMMTLRSVDLDVERVALFDRALAEEARTRKVSALKLREDYARDGANAIVAYFGGSDKAKRLGAVLQRFLLNPQRLHVRAAAPAGVGAFDALARKPADVLNDLEIDASAN